jgi:hypothetical protein
MDRHKLICCEICKKDFRSNYIKKHTDICRKRQEELKVNPTFNFQNKTHSYKLCEICDGFVRTDLFQKHNETCEEKMKKPKVDWKAYTNCETCGKSVRNDNMKKHNETCEEKMKKPKVDWKAYSNCETCGKSVRNDNMKKHSCKKPELIEKKPEFIIPPKPLERFEPVFKEAYGFHKDSLLYEKRFNEFLKKLNENPMCSNCKKHFFPEYIEAHKKCCSSEYSG